MKEAELRSVLLEFFEDHNAQSSKFLEALETTLDQIPKKDPVYDAVEGQIKFTRKIQQTTKKLIRSLATETETGASWSGPTPRKPASIVLVEDRTLSPQLGVYEQELVTAYNEQSGKWTRTYKPVGFGAENVNDIWEKGGEPKFARKEGGIYNLIEAGRCCYVVPEPGLRLLDGYFRSEGLSYLFDVAENSTESEPLICLISPAKVEESGGRWNIVTKGKLKGRK